VGAPTRPSDPPAPARVGLPPSPCQVVRPWRRVALTGATPRRVLAPEGTTPGPSPKQRPHPPRGPLLERGCVVLAVIAPTASAASLRPSRRLPAFRLYAGSLPSGRVLAGTQTFPALSHRSLPCCHRPYAGEPCGCTCPIASPQTLAFAHATEARRSHSPQLHLSAPCKGSSWWTRLTTLQRSLDAAAPRLARPLNQPTSTETAGPSGTCTSGLSRPGVAPRARRI